MSQILNTAATATAIPAPQQPPRAAHRVLNKAELRAAIPNLVRFGIVTSLFIMIFLQRFQVNIGPFFMNNGLLAQYFLIATMLFANVLRIDPTRAVLFMAGMTMLFVAWLLGPQVSSFLSAMLLVAAYMAFIFVARLPDGNEALLRFTLVTFCNLMFVVAIAGIIQFFIQFVYHPPWLFNYTPYIPLLFRGTGTYNTVIAVGSYFKSNGFFFREPSTCSQYLALALISELAMRRRRVRKLSLLRLCTFGLALLVTYSGTGLATLFIGLMFPLGLRTSLRMGGLVLAALLIYFTLGSMLNLTFTANRVEEFSNPGTSAYSRFIAPIYFIKANLDTFSIKFLVGHGPGSITRAAEHRAMFENADPTWAKLFFEYGVIGAAAFIGLILYSNIRSRAPSELIAGFCFGWLVVWGGVGLAPEITGIMFMLCAAIPRLQVAQPKTRGRVVADVGHLTMPSARSRAR